MYRIYCRLLIFAGILVMPTVVFAYVDPGFLSSLYQVFYVVIFGAVSAWIISPWKYIKSLFKRKNKKFGEKVVDGAKVDVVLTKDGEKNLHGNSEEV